MRLLTTGEQTEYLKKSTDVIIECLDEIEKLLEIQRDAASVARFIRSIDYKDPSLTTLNKIHKRYVSKRSKI